MGICWPARRGICLQVRSCGRVTSGHLPRSIQTPLDRNASAFCLLTHSASDISMTVPLRPPPTSPTPTDALRVAINTEHNLALAAYDDLLAWSSSHIASFWSQVWDFAHPVIGTKPNHGFVDASALPGSNPAWFTGATLNWAENILRYRTDTTALIEAGRPYPVYSCRRKTLSLCHLFFSRAPTRSCPC